MGESSFRLTPSGDLSPSHPSPTFPSSPTRFIPLYEKFPESPMHNKAEERKVGSGNLCLSPSKDFHPLQSSPEFPGSPTHFAHPHEEFPESPMHDKVAATKPKFPGSPARFAHLHEAFPESPRYDKVAATKPKFPGSPARFGYLHEDFPESPCHDKVVATKPKFPGSPTRSAYLHEKFSESPMHDKVAAIKAGRSNVYSSPSRDFHPSNSSSKFPGSPARFTPLHEKFPESPMHDKVHLSPRHPGSPAPSTPLHKFTASMMEENIEDAELIIMKWDASNSKSSNVPSLFLESREEAQVFLKAIKDLKRAMNFLVSEDPTSSRLVLAQSLMQIAMKRLEKEFYQVLAINRDLLGPDSVSGKLSGVLSNLDGSDEGCSQDETRAPGDLTNEDDQISVLAMSDLEAIADCMISCGYAKECVKIYRMIRASIVNEGMYYLGVEKMEKLASFRIHRMSWEALEGKIKHWLKVVNIAVRRLFNGERILIDHVFPASEAVRESIYFEITKEGAMNLFKFPELVATGPRSQERIYRLLELYEAFSILWPDMESIFSFESTLAIREQALTSWLKLGQSVLAILSDFESSIQKYSSKSVVDGGGIHPLTISAMEYIYKLTGYSRVLNEILADYPSTEDSVSSEAYMETPHREDIFTCAVSGRLARLILVLLCKLDSKSELYKDPALSYLFLANNLQFVINKVQTTELQNLLDDEWIIKHIKKVKLYASNYELMAWNKVYTYLPDLSSAITPEMIEDCFRRFNASFEEAYRKQASWVIPDGKLRDEIKLSIAKNLVPRYQEFFDTCLLTLGEEKSIDAWVKYSPDDLGNYLSDLFHGNSISGSSSSSSSSSSRSHSHSHSHSRSRSRSHSHSDSHSHSNSLLRRILM